MNEMPDRISNISCLDFGFNFVTTFKSAGVKAPKGLTRFNSFVRKYGMNRMSSTLLPPCSFWLTDNTARDYPAAFYDKDRDLAMALSKDQVSSLQDVDPKRICKTSETGRPLENPQDGAIALAVNDPQRLIVLCLSFQKSNTLADMEIDPEEYKNTPISEINVRTGGSVLLHELMHATTSGYNHSKWEPTSTPLVLIIP